MGSVLLITVKTKQFDVSPKDMQYFRLGVESWRWTENPDFDSTFRRKYEK